MMDRDLKILIGVAVFPFVCLAETLFFDYSKNLGKNEVVQELCSKTKYDFCVPKQEWGLKK